MKLEKLESTAKYQQSKISILNLWMNIENSCPNLNFTVENNTGNLQKIKLFTFQT